MYCTRSIITYQNIYAVLVLEILIIVSKNQIMSIMHVSCHIFSNCFLYKYRVVVLNLILDDDEVEVNIIFEGDINHNPA